MRGFVLALAVVWAGCADRSGQPLSYDPPGSTDTRSKPIQRQARQTWSLGEIGLTNAYPGARLIRIEPANDSLLVGEIAPENAPINNSAWFGFKIWSSEPTSRWIRLEYTDGDHRYIPKLSVDGISWRPIAPEDYSVDTTGTADAAQFRLDLSSDTLWVAGQERWTSAQFDQWTRAMADSPFVERLDVGSSTDGGPLRLLDIGTAQADSEFVLIISRQHPPEVTGTHALIPFVERLAAEDSLATAFRARYRTLVVPLMNPDGVDGGHWRHNAGGVDLNRDWMNFHQPETRQVSEYFVQRVGEGTVRFAIDFHSTQEDVFYTTSRDLEPNTPGLIDLWLGDIGQALPDYHVNDDPSGVESPTSKSWFYRQFNATSLTYEVGDEQDRELIRRVAVAGAESLMRRLLALPATNR